MSTHEDRHRRWIERPYFPLREADTTWTKGLSKRVRNSLIGHLYESREEVAEAMESHEILTTPGLGSVGYEEVRAWLGLESGKPPRAPVPRCPTCGQRLPKHQR